MVSLLSFLLITLVGVLQLFVLALLVKILLPLLPQEDLSKSNPVQTLRQKVLKKLTSTTSKEEYASTLEENETMELREAFDEAMSREGGMTVEEEYYFRNKQPEWLSER